MKWTEILTKTLRLSKFIKIKSLYRNEVNIKCVCGKEDIIKVKDIEKYQAVRCNDCYSLINDIEKDEQKIEFLSQLIVKYIQ